MKDNGIDISIFQMSIIRHKIDEMDCTFESGGNMGGSSFREIAISPEGLICVNLFSLTNARNRRTIPAILQIACEIRARAATNRSGN